MTRRGHQLCALQSNITFFPRLHLRLHYAAEVFGGIECGSAFPHWESGHLCTTAGFAWWRSSPSFLSSIHIFQRFPAFFCLSLMLPLLPLPAGWRGPATEPGQTEEPPQTIPLFVHANNQDPHTGCVHCLLPPPRPPAATQSLWHLLVSGWYWVPDSGNRESNHLVS